MNKMFSIVEVPVKEVLIEDRGREDLGDLTELMADIKKVGQLFPILITPEQRLIDGERRLTAFKHLKIPNITARIMPDLAADDLILIERMANESKKDFLWHEELSLRYKLHLLWKKQAGNEPWGYRETAKKLGCSVGGLSTDLALAEALSFFPELKACPTKGKARETYKKMGEQAEAINSMNNLDDAEKDRLKQMMSGAKIPVTKKDKPKLKAKYDDTVPIMTDSTDGSTIERTVEASEPVEVVEPSLPEVTYAIEPLETFIPKIPDNTVGFVEMDPPYAIDFNTNYGKLSDITDDGEEDWTTDQLFTFYQTMLPIIYKKMLPASWVLCWTGKEHWIETNRIAESCGFGVQFPGIWKKKGGSVNSPKTNLVSNYEMFLLFRKGQATFNTNSMPAAFDFDPPSGSQRIHKWEKPRALYAFLMSVFGRPGSIFLSPFAGSGNALIEAAKAGMLPMGCDKKDKHVYSFYQRFQSAFE